VKWIRISHRSGNDDRCICYPRKWLGAGGQEATDIDSHSGGERGSCL
jgi:hypothetical protein